MADISDSITGMVEDTQDNGSSQASDQPTPQPPPAPEKAELQEQYSGGLEYIRSGDDPKEGIPTTPVDSIELDEFLGKRGQTRSTPDPGSGSTTEGGTETNPPE